MYDMSMDTDCTMYRRKARDRGVVGMASLDEIKSEFDRAPSL